MQVTVTDEGRLTVTLDRQPYEAGRIERGDVGRVVGDIARDLGSPVRVEVRELDGAVFTDIVTPRSSFEPGATEPAKPADAPVATASQFGIAGTGFAPGEEVAVAVVVANQVAAQDGTAHLRLPPALLADRPVLVLLGRTSGTAAVSAPTKDGAA